MSTALTQKKDRLTLTPTSLHEAMEFAGMLAKSSIVPKDYQGNPGNILVAVQWGMELGLQPLQAMQSIAVINGRPAIWGDAMLALVRSSGLLEAFDEDAQETSATCTLQRRGEKPISRTFTLEQAKRAGLPGKSGPWQQYPQRMLQMRARAFALRDAFPDVLRGVHIAEEAADLPVERAMGPVPQAEGPPVSKIEALRQRLSLQMQQPPAVTLCEVLGQIDAATSETELKAAAEQAARLTNDEDRMTARAAYKQARKRMPKLVKTEDGAVWVDAAGEEFSADKHVWAGSAPLTNAAGIFVSVERPEAPAGE